MDRTGLGAPAERGSRGAWRVGSLGGIDVMVRSSWVLVALLLAYVFGPVIRQRVPELGWSGAYVAGLAFAVLLTLSLLLHELSHAWVAKHYGIPVRSITLHFIGGVTAIDGEPRTPGQEFTISAVGPVTSLGVGGAALLLQQVTPDGPLNVVVGLLAGANLLVGVINLIPGMPLDGGRILRAVVWRASGDPVRGTLVSGWAGRGVALLVVGAPGWMLLAGVRVQLLDLLIAAVFGWFLWSSASNAILAAQVRARLPALNARALARRAVSVPGDLALSEAVRRAEETRAGSIVTVDAADRLLGVVSEAAVRATPVPRRPWVPASAVSRTLDAGLRLPADLAGESLVRAMQASPASEYALLERDGTLYGVLVSADVDAAFRAGTGRA